MPLDPRSLYRHPELPKSRTGQSGASTGKTLIALTLILLAGLGTWYFLHNRQVGGDGEPPTIRVAYAPVVLNLPSFVAQDQGMFAKQSVKTDYKVFSSANDMINALVANQVEAVTGVSLVPILNLEAQSPGRVRVVLHSRMTNEAPFDGIVVKKDSAIQTLADLSGKKLGLFPGTTALNLMKALLKKHGVATDSIQFIQLPPPSHLSALQSGSIDALLAYEPTLSTALQQGFRRVFGSIYADLLSPNPISATIIARKFEKEHPTETAAFVSALDMAISTIRKEPDIARKSLLNHTKIPPEVASKVNLVPDVLSTEPDITNVQAFIDLLVSIGELPKRVDAQAIFAPTK